MLGLPALFGFMIVFTSPYLRRQFIEYSQGQSAIDNSTVATIFTVFFLMLLFAWPEISQKNSALARFNRDAKKLDYEFQIPYEMKGFLMIEGSTSQLMAIDKQKIEMNPEIYRSWQSSRHPKQEIFQSEYAYALASGINTLNLLNQQYGRGPVVNFDFSNPFSALAGAEPAKGDLLWYHPGRNITSQIYPDPNVFLSNTRYVAVPKYPAGIGPRDLLLALYGQYLKDNFIKVADTSLWTFYLSNSVKTE